MSNSIGNKIQYQRKKKKLTQKNFAILIDKSERMIQKYESGDVIPSLEMIHKIAIVLECNINDLIGYEYTSDDIEFLDAPIEDNGELKNFCTLLELLGYKFRSDGSIYNILNDKEEPILTCTSEELISYSSKITNSLKDFLEITIKHLL